MTDTWDDYAEDWDNNIDVKRYSQNAFTCLVDITELKGIRVLDFGCGTGQLSEKLSPLADTIVALDPSEKMIEILENKHLEKVVPIHSELTHELIETNDNFFLNLIL